MACEYCGTIDDGLHHNWCPNEHNNLSKMVEQVDTKELQYLEQNEDTSDFQSMAVGKYWWRYLK